MARIKKDLEQKIRGQAKERCGYCLNLQELIPYKLEIEHILPRASGGTSEEANLWLACRECNSHKAARIKAVDFLTNKTVRFFNPRKQKWRRHFEFSADKTNIVGKTACGRATVNALRMNSIWQKTARRAWLETGKFPPED